MTWSLAGLLMAGVCVLLAGSAGAAGAVTVWPAPAGETLFPDFALRVGNKAVPVYACRVSAVPLNQVWPGYQRPLDQTEQAGFAHWAQSGPVTVEVTAKRPFMQATVRPLSRGVRPRVQGQRIVFTLDKPGQVTVELDGRRQALHLFADSPETNVPEPGAPGVRYFGPGVHRPGKLDLKSGETLYIAGGAVVYTAVSANKASHVRILGRGIIDTSTYERDQGGGCIRLTDCTDVQIEGVILRDPDVWCLSAFGCRDLQIANVKLIGLWRYNADGIDLCNTQNAVVRDSFVRAFDDAIVLKGLRWDGGYHERPVQNIRVYNNVLWCDWGRALEIGAETSAPEFTNIVFRDCDIIRTTHIAMDIQCGDRAVVHNVLYDNIRVEIDDVCPAPKMQQTREERYVEDPNDAYTPYLMVIVIASNPYSKDTELGRVHGITYRNIRVTGKRTPASWFRGAADASDVRDITIDGLVFNGQPVRGIEEARLSLGPHVSGVTAR